MLGASNVQVCTAVMHYGFGIIREMIPGLENYMREKGFQKLNDLIGIALPNVMAWENLNLKYDVKAHINAEKCIGCQLCYTACDDGAHQAIALPTNGSRVPEIIEKNCVGCNLCSLVCPVEECISMVRNDDGKQHETWGDYMANGKAPTTFNDDRAGGKGHWVPEPTAGLKK